MRKRIVRTLSLAVLTWALSMNAVVHAATPTDTDDTPLATVRVTVDRVLAVLTDATLSEEARRRQVKAIVAQHFDFKAMANRVLATNWRKASKAERARFTSLFRELLTNTYWAKISAYTNEKVEYLGEKRSSDKLATVNTVIHTSTADIPVDYKLYRTPDGWAAYDVVIEQVSLVRNYRSSFQTIVHDVGIAGLLSQLEIKVAESSAVAE